MVVLSVMQKVCTNEIKSGLVILNHVGSYIAPRSHQTFVISLRCLAACKNRLEDCLLSFIARSAEIRRLKLGAAKFNAFFFLIRRMRIFAIWEKIRPFLSQFRKKKDLPVPITPENLPLFFVENICAIY